MEKITKLGLLCSLGGLAAIYAGAVYVRPSVTPIAKIGNEFIGLKVIISSQVVDLRVERPSVPYAPGQLRWNDGGADIF
jgi:hypothetical protein